MARAFAHKTYPARIVADVNGEEIELVSFNIDIPFTAKTGDTITDEDGRKRVVVSIAPAPAADIARAVRRALRRRTVLAV